MFSRRDKNKTLLVVLLGLFSFLPLCGWDFFAPMPKEFDWLIFEEMNLRNPDYTLNPNVYPIPPIYIPNFVDLSSGYWKDELVYLFGGFKRGWGVDINPSVVFQRGNSPLPALLVGAGAEFSSFGIYSSYIVDRKLAKDENYRGKVWHGIAGEACELGFAVAPHRDWYIRLGRTTRSIGSGLTLSNYHRPIDTEEILWLSKNFRMLSFTCFLDKYHFGNTTVYRYLSSHRFEYANRFFAVSFSEFTVYGGPQRALEWYYLIPLYFYHGEQLNREYDDNTLLLFDLRVRAMPFYFIGEFLLDDVQIEHNKPEEKAPMFYGLSAELRYMTELKHKPITLSVSYRRVSNWTFNQRNSWNRFVYEGVPLGDSLGNDYDRSKAFVRCFLRQNLALNLEFELVRKGEGRIFAEWSMPWVYVEGEYKEKFPLGIVERNYLLKAQVNYFYKRVFRMETQIGYLWRRNVGNRESDDENSLVLSFKAGLIGEFDRVLKKLLTN